MIDTIKKLGNNIAGKSFRACLLVFFYVVVPSLSFAAESGEPMPWEGPLEKIMYSISGPVAKTLGVIVIVIAGLGIAFGESGGIMRKVFQIVFGLSIAFFASSIIVSLYQPSSGLII